MRTKEPLPLKRVFVTFLSKTDEVLQNSPISDETEAALQEIMDDILVLTHQEGEFLKQNLQFIEATIGKKRKNKKGNQKEINVDEMSKKLQQMAVDISKAADALEVKINKLPS